MKVANNMLTSVYT